MKMNTQTVSVTFSDSSTLEFTDIQPVPVYEPAAAGWIDFVIHESTIAVISENGDVERWHVDTGRTERWYTRPLIQNAVTMKMRDGVGGYYYEFAKDGSIRSSCKEGTYYWGPVETVSDDSRLSFGSINASHYGTMEEVWDHLEDIRRRAVDPMEILREEIDEHWDRLMDKRWRRSTTIQDEMELDRSWLARMKERLGANPMVYNNSETRRAYEDQIREIERSIVSNQSILDYYSKAEGKTGCPECKREGVCMCYT